MKRQHTESEIIFSNHKPDKGCVSKIYILKSLFEFKNEKANNSIKMNKDLNRHLFKTVTKRQMKRYLTSVICKMPKYMRHYLIHTRMAINVGKSGKTGNLILYW